MDDRLAASTARRPQHAANGGQVDREVLDPELHILPVVRRKRIKDRSNLPDMRFLIRDDMREMVQGRPIVQRIAAVKVHTVGRDQRGLDYAVYSQYELDFVARPSELDHEGRE